MPQNIHSQNDILYVMQPTRNLMITMGIWPYRSSKISIFRKIYNLFLNFSTNFLFAWEFISDGIYWLLEESTSVRLQMGPLLLYLIMSIFQYDILLFRNEKIRQCWKHIEEDWENVLSVDTRNVMFKCAKSARLLILICAALMYSGAFMYRVILPLSQGNIITDQNVTIRPLACPVNYVYIDAQASPLYEILFISQAINGIIIVSIPTCAYGLVATFVEHANGQMKILIYLMRNLVREQWKNLEEVDKKLAEVVEHQMRVHSFLQMVQYIMQEICLAEIMANTLTICLVLYFIVLNWSAKNFGIIVSYVVNIANVTIHIFLFCYVGEQLNEQAEKVAIESHELEWYHLPKKKMRNIVLIMIMSNYPPKISAGKIMELSLKTFGNIIKTAGAYFNMLRSVTD